MGYIDRDIEKELEKWIDEKEIMLIRGPRQCGKTTLLYNIREKLARKGVPEKNIHYLTFEDDVSRLKFEEDCNSFIKSYLNDEKAYFLLDEVQYVKEIGHKLKLLFDSATNAKFIVTGSASFDLTNLGKFLVGRVIFFDLYPFSFREFLRAKGERLEKIYNESRIDIENPVIKKSIFIGELNKLLKEYLTFGAYPRVVLEQDTEKKKELLKNIFMTYIEKEVVSLYGNKYRDNVVKMLKALSSVSSILKYESISETSGLKHKQVKEILPLLEDSFVIYIVKPFHKNLLNELRKNPKVYFVDYGLRNYLSESFGNPDMGFLYENLLNNELRKRFKINFWRTTAKTEVDFVIDEKIPLEAKTSPNISRSLRSFISEYKPKYAYIANLSEYGEKEIDSCRVLIVPFAHF
jgi:predicted AAA+ superfamily ATPase